jgi:hypothetical protein
VPKKNILMIGPTSCGKTDCQLPCQDCICIFCEGMFLLFGFLVVLTGKEGILPIFLVKFFKVSMCESFGVILSV